MIGENRHLLVLRAAICVILGLFHALFDECPYAVLGEDIIDTLVDVRRLWQLVCFRGLECDMDFVQERIQLGVGADCGFKMDICETVRLDVIEHHVCHIEHFLIGTVVRIQSEGLENAGCLKHVQRFRVGTTEFVQRLARVTDQK